MTDYLTLAADMAEKAPSQARLLRHLLVNPDQTAPEIVGQLNLTDANFRVLVGKLRDKGVEVVVKRALLDPTDQTDVEYRYSIKSDEEVEHWAGGRRGALRTAWDRVEKMMIRHLRNIEELDPETRGKIIGDLERVSADIERVDVFTQVKIEEAKAEKAALLARAEANARADTRAGIEAVSD